MKVQTNIFIYHASEDNTDTLLWVSRVAEFLEASLSHMTGENIRIQLLNEHSDTNIYEMDIFIAVMSEKLVKNTVALDKLRKFATVLNISEAGNIDGNRKAYKVLKTNINPQDEPSVMRSLPPYPLLSLREETYERVEIIDYDAFFAKETKESFWISLTDLSYDIVEYLDIQREMRDRGRSKYVYLAETGKDSASERLKIKRELQKSGFITLPEKQLPDNEKLLEQYVYDDLHKCFLSIHLFGEDYGDTITLEEGTNKEEQQVSYAELQNRFCSFFATEQKKAGKNSFRRMVWLLPEARYTDERERFYVDKLKKEYDYLVNTELIENKIEDFKTAVLGSVLQDESDDEGSGLDNRNNKKSVYIISDMGDKEEVRLLKSWLKKANFEVFTNLEQSSVRAFRERHMSFLVKCDAVLVCYVNTHPQWLFSKVQDVLKANGLGRKKPLRYRAIYTKGEQNFTTVQSEMSQYKSYQSISILYNDSRSIEATLATYFQNI